MSAALLAAVEPVPSWTVHTDVFDGPLDLLLHLVRRDGVDLRQVSVARICDSYLAVLDQLRGLHIALASEWLVMAATLCHLKSLELLPRPPAILEDEAVDPKEQLALRLETYAQFKQAAEALERRAQLDRDTFTRAPSEDDDAERPLVPGIDAFALLDLYYQLLTRPAPKERVHEIHRPEVDLGACARAVLVALGGVGGSRGLAGVLRGFARRAERVVAFLAVLEMCRLGWLGLVQERHLDDVQITSRVPVDQSLDLIRGEVDDAPAEEAL